MIQSVLFDLFETLVTESNAACRNLDVAPAHTLFIGDGADDELAGARRAGVPARQALWFLARRQPSAFAPDDVGLWRPSDVVTAATAA